MNKILNSSPSLRKGLWVHDRNYNRKVGSILVAVEILMAFSPFGFIVFSSISMTTLFLGVLAAALWGGPAAGGTVGLVFGLCSMWKASVTGVNANDLIFSPVFSGAPAKSVLLALGPRILFGIIAGLVYYAVLKWIPKKGRPAAVVICSVILERIQSMLTYLFMDLVFHVEGASALNAFHNLLSAKRLREYVVVILVMLAFYLLYDRVLSGRYYEQYRACRERSIPIRRKYVVLALCSAAVLWLTAAHLWDRMGIVLYNISGLTPEQCGSWRLAQLLIQFTAAAVSALYIEMVLYRHARNEDERCRAEAAFQLHQERKRADDLEQRTQRDYLTGVYNRKGLEQTGRMAPLADGPVGYLLIDVDHFKEINDTYGHDTGDRILLAIAEGMQKEFGPYVYRMGGDEFAVLLGGAQETQWEEICEKFVRIQKGALDAVRDVGAITLSVGMILSENGYTEKLYPLADAALYETKRNGRAGATLVDAEKNVLKRISWI